MRASRVQHHTESDTDRNRFKRWESPVMQPFLRSAFRGAIRVSLQAIFKGYEQRVWEVLHIVPRLLQFRPRRGWKVPKKALEERFQLFQEGRWLELLAFCRETAPSPSVFRQTPPPAEARPRNSEARGPGTQSGAFGRVVCRPQKAPTLRRERWPH